MNSQIDPGTRPSRLSLLVHVALVVLLAVSFASGLAVWRGQFLQAEELVSPGWLRPALVLHGCLFPLQCVLFGVLLANHVRLGWQLRANLVSGFVMEAVFVGLILTGAGLYYVGAEDWRERIIWTHRLLGLALPVTLGVHWFMGHRWASRVAAA